LDGNFLISNLRPTLVLRSTALILIPSHGEVKISREVLWPFWKVSERCQCCGKEHCRGGDPMKRHLGINEEVGLRVRVSEKDVHYAGGLVNGAWVLGLFGDVATEVSIRFDGDEGLLRAYKGVDLLAPIHAGDFIEAVGKIVKVGNTSRTIELEARRYIVPAHISEQSSAADYLEEPEIVARATMIDVVPADRQRYTD
jgi:3-aminobutyryl-CoA ammonia-lyase